MTRYLRTARSTMVAVTSSGFAAKSTSVPTCPGRRPSGGTNSTGVSVCSISGSISSESPTGRPPGRPPRGRGRRPGRRRSLGSAGPARTGGAGAGTHRSGPRSGRQRPDRPAVERERLRQREALLEDRLRGRYRALRERDREGQALVEARGAVRWANRAVAPLEVAVCTGGSSPRSLRAGPRCGGCRPGR